LGKKKNFFHPPVAGGKGYHLPRREEGPFMLSEVIREKNALAVLTTDAKERQLPKRREG